MDNPEAIPYASVCTGYEGIGLGLERAGLTLRPLFTSEIEGFAASGLVAKAEAGLLGAAVNWSDLKTLPFHIFRRALRGGIFSAGFPCQPFSAAGKRMATEDPRHLWPFIADGISACRPAVVFLENVEGIISAKCRNQPGAPDGTSVLLYVLRDLESRGYRCSWSLHSAVEVGAPHRRKRVFILGVLADREGRKRWRQLAASVQAGDGRAGLAGDGEHMADPISPRPQERRGQPGDAGPECQAPKRSGYTLANADTKRHGGQPKAIGREHGQDIRGAAECSRDVANPESGGQRELREPSGSNGQPYWSLPEFPPGPNGDWSGIPEWLWPATQSGFRRLDDGSANRVDRLRSAGNGVVPATAALAFRTLAEKMK